jgi:ABC-type polysaccharide/polyol phosphate transport system ATPase subunit
MPGSDVELMETRATPAPETPLAVAPGEVVIQLDHVGVKYRVPTEHIRSFKEFAIRRLRGQVGYREFWALHDVSLTVRRGEGLVIVGHNGAGKSTLLKVIARVLRPTEGRVWVRGDVAPLLQLGAGFHPEMTGRENVWLNATLLGHSRREIEAHFREIVDFAELWDFIDAPLRTYSSGMVARLGFAVATSWHPDVLLVDELLVVGDQSFQQKCRARIDAFRAAGTTVVLVSHNMSEARALCQQALWLEHGVVRAAGPVDEITAAYEQAASAV